MKNLTEQEMAQIDARSRDIAARAIIMSGTCRDALRAGEQVLLDPTEVLIVLDSMMNACRHLAESESKLAQIDKSRRIESAMIHVLQGLVASGLDDSDGKLAPRARKLALEALEHHDEMLMDGR